VVEAFVVFLLICFCIQAEYALNFVFVALVDPVTFSVCDIARRLAVIVTGIASSLWPFIFVS
jgi:hypothetical protein